MADIQLLTRLPGLAQSFAHRLDDLAKEIGTPFHRDLGARPENRITNLLTRADELGGASDEASAAMGSVAGDLHLAKASYELGDIGAAQALVQHGAGTARALKDGISPAPAAAPSDINHAARLLGGSPDDLLTDGLRS